TPHARLLSTEGSGRRSLRISANDRLRSRARNDEFVLVPSSHVERMDAGETPALPGRRTSAFDGDVISRRASSFASPPAGEDAGAPTRAPARRSPAYSPPT